LLLGESAPIRLVREQIARVAPGRATVLITGETGAGKELVATAIHENSPRRNRRFLKVNCAALPEPLLESELFGHERGAFTGAQQRRTGRFEEADGGTLLLDEVGDMHPRTQAKVLRVLQEREFERLGGSRPIRVDVRILAATNQDLQRLIEEGRFRADLYYRLNVVSIHLPPLRERPVDIPLLASVFLSEFNRESPRPKRGFTADALEALDRYDWPGSVRELRNTVQRSVLMGDRQWIEAADLGLPFNAPGSEGPSAGSPGMIRLPEEGADYREVERALILSALERTGWVQKRAAEHLRMSRRRLNYRIRRLGIYHPSWPRNRS
jgi:transcriptional regulator with GAF, ATPase, and Fis domain